MKKFGKSIGTALVISTLLAMLSACDKREGPAEHAGKEADKATAELGQQIEKVGKNIQDTAQGNKK